MFQASWPSLAQCMDNIDLWMMQWENEQVIMGWAKKRQNVGIHLVGYEKITEQRRKIHD